MKKYGEDNLETAKEVRTEINCDVCKKEILFVNSKVSLEAAVNKSWPTRDVPMYMIRHVSFGVCDECMEAIARFIKERHPPVQKATIKKWLTSKEVMKYDRM